MPTNGRVEVLETSLRARLRDHKTALPKQPEHDEQARAEVGEPRQRAPASDLPALSILRVKLQRLGLDVDVETLLAVQRKMEMLERQGWRFDGAEASFVLLILKLLNCYCPWFELERYSVLARGGGNQREDAGLVEASVKLKLNGVVWHTIREGRGPVHALDLALREALRPSYPRLDETVLTDYTIRVIDGKRGAAAPVRVVLQSWDSHHNRNWGSAAVSEDVARASWLALVDALEFKKWLDANETSVPGRSR